jgi:hypothetical protein
MLSSSHWGWPIRPTFWISCLWPYKAYITVNDVFKGTSSKKKNSQDNLLALTYFLNFYTVFRSNLPLKKGRSNVTYPVRDRVNVRACTAYLNINILLSLKSNVVHSKHKNWLSDNRSRATLKIHF